jgi:hypothetical protein
MRQRCTKKDLQKGMKTLAYDVMSHENFLSIIKDLKKEEEKRVSNNSCDSLCIHDNSTTNSCEVLKTIYLGNKVTLWT